MVIPNGMSSNGNAQLAALLRRYSKLQTACTEVCEALKVIENNALSADEIRKLSAGGGELEQAVSKSSLVSLTTFLKGTESTSQVLQAYDSKKFKEDAEYFNGLVRYPVISDSSLENLAFLHRSWASMNAHATKIDMAVATNERLEFLGDSWIGAFVSYILYKKYPYANEGALSKMRSAIVNNINLVKWCKRVGFDQRLRANIPTRVNQIKDANSKYHADCFEAYIGALVIDRYSAEFSGVVDWIEGLSAEIFEQMGSQMVPDPMNKNAKHELSSLLLHNKAGAQLSYHRLNATSPFKVEVKLGDISLATGEGSSIREAEQRAAMKALLDTDKLRTYSLYEIEDRQIEASSTEPIDLLGKVVEEENSQPVLDASPSEESLEPQQEEQSSESVSVEDISGSTSSESAPGGLSQAQMASIIEQLTGQLKETVLSTVTAAMKDGGLKLQPEVNVAKVEPTSQPKKVKGTPVRGLNAQDAPTQARTSKTGASYAEPLQPFGQLPVKTRTKINPPQNITGQGLPSSISQMAPSVTSRAPSNGFPQALPPSQSAPTPFLPPTQQPASSQRVFTAQSNQPYPVSALQKAAGDLNVQKSPANENIVLDSTCKQRLYALLGPRGCKPWYKTETIDVQTFSSSCMIEGFSIVLGTGTASSKKQAEQIAAFHGLKSDELQEFLANPSAFSLANL